jgi:hypothetical protein
MALVLADRVLETTSVAGTGDAALNGAQANFQPFSVIGNGNTTYYTIVDNTNNEWEVGIGTYVLAGNKITRDTVLSSSNGGAFVYFPSGDKDIFCDLPAEKIDNPDAVTSVNGQVGVVVLTAADVGAQPAGTYVTSVGATSPVTSSGGTTPTIAMPAATTSVSGYLTSSDWNTFNNKSNTSGTVTSITAGTGLTGGTITSSGTIAIDSSVVTLNGVQTLTNKTLTTPVVNTSLKLNGPGITSYTPFADTMASFVADDNDYKLVYIQNKNNGSDASADYVAYNDASDVDSYFIDMGIGSSNYTSAVYPIFPANAGYVYTGGGSSGQASALLLGTSNTASDIVMFTGGVDTVNEAIRVYGADQTVEVQKGVTLNDTLDVTGAATFGSTVLLDADPTTALQAATKQYVDNQVTAGLHIHDPVRVETTGNLTATYAQGGTTFNITAITLTTTVTTSVNHGLSVNDQIWLTSTAGNGLSINTAYFVYSTPALNTLTLSLTYDGAQITGLTNASGLAYATRANSGVGATLTNAGVQLALNVDSVALSVGNRVMVRLQTNGAENGVYEVTTVGTILTNWVLTRTADASIVSPTDVNGLGTGDYFFTQEGALNAGDSHVLTTEPNTMIIGYTPLTYTQFSGGVTYVGGTNIDVTGQTISLTGTVAATNGGTGTGTVATGDLLYGSATDTWSKLPLGVAYKSLIINASGTQVEWNAIPLNQPTAVSGQLSVSNGGTGVSSITGIVKGNGTSAFTAATPGTDYAPATSGSAILYGNGAGGFSSVTIGTGVSFAGGTLSATGSGGTVTSVTGTAPVVSSGGNTPAISMAAATTSVDGYLTSTDWNTFNGKAPATFGTSILYGNGSGGFSNVTVGSGLSFSAGTLSAASSSGTVTSVSVVSANGFAGTVATATSTPAISLSTTITGVIKGNGTAISAATAGTDYSAGTSALGTGILKSTTATGALTIAVAADFPTLNQNTTGSSASCTGNAATATTATNLSGGTVAATTITATGSVTAFFSDDRLKTRHGKIENALDKIQSLEGFYYTPNQVAQDLGYEAIQDVGVSAQAVQAILPEVVAPAPIDDKYLTVRYEKLVPLLIEAIKELKAELEQVKATMPRHIGG